MAFDDGVKTVSGSIAHTDDAATKVPFVSVKCGIEPTLTGVSEVSATQTGENLFDKAAVIDDTWIVVNDTTTESAVGYRTSDYIPVKANTRYYVSTKGSNRTAYYDKNKNGIAYFSFSGGQSFNCLYDGYIRITIKNDVDLDTFIVNEGSTAIPYEPYNGTTHTANLGRTINGGTADIVNGVGTDNTTRIQIKDRTWTITEVGTSFKVFTCNKITTKEANFNFQVEGYENAETYRNYLQDKQCGTYNTTNAMDRIVIRDDSYTTVEDFLTAVGDNYIVFENTTPTNFTFTPITPTPETVGKVNNVYCNTGNTEVTYYDNAHGFAEVTVNKTGKNLIDGTKFTRGLPSTTIGANIDTITASNRYAYYGVRAGGGSLTVSSTSSNTDYFTLVLIWGYKNGVLTYYSNTQAGTSKTVDFSNCDYVRIGIGAVSGTTVPTDLTGYGSIQLELGSQATSYTPYEAVSKTAYLHKVIYGGQADVVKGTCKPKNLLANLGTFPFTASFTSTYYVEFANNIQARKIPLFALQNNVTYVLSADVECSLEPFNLTIGVGNGRYLRDIANGSAQYTSGRVYLKFTPTNLTEGNNYLAFRVPRYGTTKNFEVTISNVQLEIGDTASEYAPHFDPFTFPPISMSTDEGENTLFANEGDSAITYRKAVD